VSAEVRLDAATLEWVAEQMRSGRDDVRRGMDQRVWMSSMAALLEKCAAEARSRPPALSDWVLACEVAGAGAVGLDRDDDGNSVIWCGDSAFCAYVDGSFATLSGAPLTARLGYADTVYRTPAELRAALEALASEVPS